MKSVKCTTIIFLIFALVISFTGCSLSQQQICIEEYAVSNGYSVETCGRCGYTSITLKNGDILLLHWDSPYVDYQNKQKRIKLRSKTRYYNSLTYADKKLLKII